MNAREQSRLRTLTTRVKRGTATTAEILEFHALGESQIQECNVRAPAVAFQPRTVLEFHPDPKQAQDTWAALGLE